MKKRIKEHIPNQSLRKLSKETPKLFSVIIITIIFYKKNSLSLSLSLQSTTTKYIFSDEF